MSPTMRLIRLEKPQGGGHGPTLAGTPYDKKEGNCNRVEDIGTHALRGRPNSLLSSVFRFLQASWVIQILFLSEVSTGIGLADKVWRSRWSRFVPINGLTKSPHSIVVVVIQPLLPSCESSHLITLSNVRHISCRKTSFVPYIFFTSQFITLFDISCQDMIAKYFVKRSEQLPCKVMLEYKHMFCSSCLLAPAQFLC
jgi:hypothetical protein